MKCVCVNQSDCGRGLCMAVTNQSGTPPTRCGLAQRADIGSGVGGRAVELQPKQVGQRTGGYI